MSILVDTFFSPTYTDVLPLTKTSTFPTIVNSPLYTTAQQERRDNSPWTMVQGILAPLQLLVCAISLYLVLHYLNSGEGVKAAGISVVIKTGILYTIMITGCLWEHDVFGRYLFAPAFFWEDAVSMVVIALHTLYLFVYFSQIGSTNLHMQIALLAYCAYFVNAAQFIYKFRLARLTRAMV